MELKDYIELGAKKAGSVSALARYLQMNQPDLSNAKSHKKGLPDEALSKLADYIGTDYRILVAANKLVTEKNETKRAYWRPFVEHARAAMLAALVTCLGVVNFVTSTPAEASERGISSPDSLYYVKFC